MFDLFWKPRIHQHSFAFDDFDTIVILKIYIYTYINWKSIKKVILGIKYFLKNIQNTILQNTFEIEFPKSFRNSIRVHTPTCLYFSILFPISRVAFRATDYKIRGNAFRFRETSIVLIIVVRIRYCAYRKFGSRTINYLLSTIRRPYSMRRKRSIIFI